MASSTVNFPVSKAVKDLVVTVRVTGATTFRVRLWLFGSCCCSRRTSWAVGGSRLTSTSRERV